MIKKCVYGKEEFEIEFEWPLSEKVVKNTEQIHSFIDKINSVPGTVILKKGDDITGLILSYKGFYELLNLSSAGPGRDVRLVDEFKQFFCEAK